MDPLPIRLPEGTDHLTAGDFDAFVHLKDNWAAYKKEHGIR